MPLKSEANIDRIGEIQKSVAFRRMAGVAFQSRSTFVLLCIAAVRSQILEPSGS